VNQVYNVAVGDQTSLNELHDLLAEFLSLQDPDFVPMRPAYKDFRAGDVRFSRADISKAENLLGFHPELRVRDGLARAIAWYVQCLRPAKKPPESMVLSAGGVPEAFSNSAERMGHRVGGIPRS